MTLRITCLSPLPIPRSERRRIHEKVLSNRFRIPRKLIGSFSPILSLISWHAPRRSRMQSEFRSLFRSDTGNLVNHFLGGWNTEAPKIGIMVKTLERLTLDYSLLKRCARKTQDVVNIGSASSWLRCPLSVGWAQFPTVRGNLLTSIWRLCWSQTSHSSNRRLKHSLG